MLDVLHNLIFGILFYTISSTFELTLNWN